MIFEADVTGTDKIKFWIMSWCSKALLLEPRSLRYEVRLELVAMLEEYSKDIAKEERPLRA